MATVISLAHFRATGQIQTLNAGSPLEKLFSVGERVSHLKFGKGNVTQANGDKLTVQFDRAGERRVLARFLDHCEPLPTQTKAVPHHSDVAGAA